MKRAVVLAIAVLFLVPLATRADWAGYNWHVAATPPTHVPLCDSTPSPLSTLVHEVADTWSAATSVFKLDYRQSSNCGANGEIEVRADYLSGAAASWTTLWLNQKGNTNIRKASVQLNTWFQPFGVYVNDPVYEPTRRYLICHEMGGALGLQENTWPPEDTYHYGCMNLSGDGRYPSQADIDTLNAVYQ